MSRQRPTHIRGANGEMVSARDVLTDEELRAQGYQPVSKPETSTFGPIPFDNEAFRESDRQLFADLAAIDEAYARGDYD